MKELYIELIARFIIIITAAAAITLCVRWLLIKLFNYDMFNIWE